MNQMWNGSHWFILIGLLLIQSGTDFQQQAVSEPLEEAYLNLNELMDQNHREFVVYRDINHPANHFFVRAKMPADGKGSMDEDWDQNSYSGSTCIRCTFEKGEPDWAGFYFQNGVYYIGDPGPQQNWGSEPSAGYDLTGASKLVFYARGDRGGERVEFFVGGITGNYPDTCPKVSAGFRTLTKEWQRFEIDLRGRDLSYMIDGFGWVVEGNEQNQIAFYIDEIYFERSSLNDPRFLVSYDTLLSQEVFFDEQMKSVAYSYDNALALLAYLVQNTDDSRRRTQILADSFVYAQKHDRFFQDNRLRNAYSAGELTLPPGWEPSGRPFDVRLPGYWDSTGNTFQEDIVQVSTSTGSMAWVVIALSHAYKEFNQEDYKNAAVDLGGWIHANSWDNRGIGGYTSGYQGFDENQNRLFTKSTEDNLVVYCSFMLLYELTQNEQWKKRADQAKSFALSMWDSEEKRFWTWTETDGVTINKNLVLLSPQPLVPLAMGEEGRIYWGCLDTAQEIHGIGGGYDMNDDRDGTWYEGTARMACALQRSGRSSEAAAVLHVLEEAQSAFSTGALPASSVEPLTTGFDWSVFRRGHAATTSWFIFAEQGINPFWSTSTPISDWSLY